MNSSSSEQQQEIAAQESSSLEIKSKRISKFLSDLVVFSKYAGIVEGEHRKQTWEECVDKFKNMLVQDHPELKDEIETNFRYVYERKVFPSMRSMQYGGDPISFNPTRIYNCSFALANDIKVFSEFIWILLSGAGIGSSVQKRHINNLPTITEPNGRKRFLISDSIEGWADSIRMLMYAYFRGNPYPDFDFRDIRPSGSLIKKLNCIAPGPAKLKEAIINVDRVLKNAMGRKLRPIEVLDIMNYIAECVVSGGIRTSAVIILFDKDEDEIIHCKKELSIKDAKIVEENDECWMIEITPDNVEDFYGQESKTVKIYKSFGEWDKDRIINDHKIQWYNVHPQRSMSNNSVVLHRNDTTYEEFMNIMMMAWKSGSGEPGICWTNDYDMGTNPCFSGESLILTGNQGFSSLKDLWEKSGYQQFVKGKTVDDYGRMDIVNSYGKQSSSNVFMTSKLNNVYKVTMSNGSEQEVTANHHFIVLDDKNKKTKKKTSELTFKDRIPLTNYSKIEKETGYEIYGKYDQSEKFVNESLASLLGLTITNGSKIRTNDGKSLLTIRAFNNDVDVDKIDKILLTLTNVGLVKSSTKNVFEKFVEYTIKMIDATSGILNSLTNKIDLKKLLKLQDKTFVSLFLNSYIGSCGNISINREKATIKCWDNNKEFLQKIQILLSTFDIYSNIVMHRPNKKDNDLTKMIGNNVINHIEGYDLLISGYYYVDRFIKQIGMFYDCKHIKVCQLLKLMNKDVISKQSKPMMFIKPVSIEFIGKKETYCLNEPRNNEVIVNGNIIGQCGEISLNDGQFCNLTTVNAYDIETQEEFNKRARAASFIGTLQASYTNFHYLRTLWRENTQKDALLGVSMTGVASTKIFGLDEREAAKEAVKENERVSAIIGINPAQRVTTIKPEGTTTLVAGVFGAGVHAAYSEYLYRRIRVRKTDPLYNYISTVLCDFVEPDYIDEDRVVLTIPLKADKGCVYRTEPTIDLLERVKRLYNNWILPGHKSGANTNNVSSTISVRPNEITEVSQWMWDNRNCYNGITILPYDGGSYKQAPYEEITEEQYLEAIAKFPDDLTLKDVFVPDFTDLTRESACAGSGCDVKIL